MNRSEEEKNWSSAKAKGKKILVKMPIPSEDLQTISIRKLSSSQFSFHSSFIYIKYEFFWALILVANFELLNTHTIEN